MTWSLKALVVLILTVSVMFFVNKCGSKLKGTSNTTPESGSLPVKELWFKQMVVISPKKVNNGLDRQTQSGSQRTSTGTVQGISGLTEEGTGKDRGDNDVFIPTSQLGRNNSILYDPGRGQLSFKWYSFDRPRIGIEAFSSIKERGFGLDTRFAHIQDFSSIIGAAYFTKEKKLSPSVGVAYNLRRIELLSNSDVFVSWTLRSVIFGFRVEL